MGYAKPIQIPAGWEHPKEKLTRRQIVAEHYKCSQDPNYFLVNYCYLEVRIEGAGGSWEPFIPWPAQRATGQALLKEKLVAVPKTRQAGVTWLCLGLILWEMEFKPGTAAGLWSRRATEASDLLQRRLKRMYARLPTWMHARHLIENSTIYWELSNGSRAMAFPTSAGDSYAFNRALVDEADFCPDLANLMEAVKPTIDGGGSMWLVSKVDKKRPITTFKRLCRQSAAGRGPWKLVFLPWWSRPGRDRAFHQAQKEHSLAQNGTLDYLHGNYPATLNEALSASSFNKRIPVTWLDPSVERMVPLENPLGAPAIPELRVYHSPHRDRSYVMGSDVAKGLPDGDDSTVSVVDQETGRECAVVQGKLGNRDALPAAITLLSAWYNDAPVLVERNSIGEGTIAVLEMEGKVRLLDGPDDKPGYQKSAQSRTKLWDTVVTDLKERSRARKHGQDLPALIHDSVTEAQLASLERDTCKAPDGLADDVSDAWGLAQWARLECGASGWIDWDE